MRFLGNRKPKPASVADAGDSRSYPFSFVSVIVALPRPLRPRDESRALAAALLSGSCSDCRGLAVKDFGGAGTLSA
jgi:hypothetical protein